MVAPEPSEAKVSELYACSRPSAGASLEKALTMVFWLPIEMRTAPCLFVTKMVTRSCLSASRIVFWPTLMSFTNPMVPKADVFVRSLTLTTMQPSSPLHRFSPMMSSWYQPSHWGSVARRGLTYQMSGASYEKVAALERIVTGLPDAPGADGSRGAAERITTRTGTSLPKPAGMRNLSACSGRPLLWPGAPRRVVQPLPGTTSNGPAKPAAAKLEPAIACAMSAPASGVGVSGSMEMVREPWEPDSTISTLTVTVGSRRPKSVPTSVIIVPPIVGTGASEPALAWSREMAGAA
mmetsp:Transcript_16565/g.62668  ORF Transcript_16565/g.62668 Transcript_16565/m.62668 type:complete len:293 (-) Transcript_16565:852-1730(-)